MHLQQVHLSSRAAGHLDLGRGRPRTCWDESEGGDRARDGGGETERETIAVGGAAEV